MLFRLPAELLQLIVDQLDHSSYYHLSASCRSLYEILLSTEFIKHRILLHWPMWISFAKTSTREDFSQLSIISSSENEINCAVDNNFRPIVRYLIIVYTTPKTNKRLIEDNINRLIQHDYYAELMYLNRRGLQFTDNMAMIAAKKGLLHILKYMEVCGLIIESYMMDQAAAYGHLAILHYFGCPRDNLPLVIATAYGAKKAINNGHRDVVDYLAAQGIIAVPTKRKLEF